VHQAYPVTLFGRAGEQAAIDALLGGAREGQSHAVILRGAAGIGKTALLEYAAQAAGGMRVLRAAGVETEAELAFSGLHLLLRPVLARSTDLPAPQANALRGALGLSMPGVHDRFLVGLSVLSLLSELANDSPVVCLIDDSHWLDAASADALLFAARRLDAEGVVMMLATRDGSHLFAAAGLQELSLTPLTADDAGQMLDERTPSLAPVLRKRVLAEAAGNPLALMELATAVPADAGAAGAGPLPVTQRVQELLATQVRRLGDQAQLMLLLAAAEPTGDLPLILQAAACLGAEIDALAGAERAQLVAVAEGRVVFRHPLVRAAAYHDAPLALRLAAHRALAETLTGQPDQAERRAWHLAEATSGKDEAVAAELECVAERSRAQGGYAAVSAAYERAAQLTPDLEPRARRLLAAAGAASDVGQMSRADRLASQAVQLTTDPLLLADLAHLRTTQVTGDRRERIAALATAASRVADRDPRRAAGLLCQALRAAWADGPPDLYTRLTAQLHDLALPSGTSLRPVDEAIFQRARLAAGDPGASAAVIRDCIAVIRQEPSNATPHERVSASSLAFVMGDHDATREISAALADDCRRQGIVGWLPGALQGLATAHILRGEWPDARACAVEGLKLACDMGLRPRAAFLASLLGQLAAYAGDEDACLNWLAEHRQLGGSPGPNANYQATQLALVDLGENRFGRAYERLTGLVDIWWGGTEFTFQPDLVEAAARTGDLERAREAIRAFEAWADLAAQPWAQAVTHRCVALVSDDAVAEEHYLAAVKSHENDGRPFERARTQLLYGEWLRRNRRRRDARVNLLEAFETFDDLGAVSWARRATAEVAATGGPAPSRPARRTHALSRLTPQELQVIRLAATGLSNRDIGAQMFLSPRTVGYHLYKAFPKLGVTSRSQLARLVGGEQP
jgi:DNA-binding CsgD family transcriptional regulator